MNKKTYFILKIIYFLILIAAIFVFGLKIYLGNKIYIVVLILVIFGLTKDLWFFKKKIKEKDT
ncbi:hypothetical protein DOK78_001956 [Enterococcus sp. DIV2402]|uniref:Uncharacterized protein n=1 Tax=Candidatus Enterococcus lowellii TaxID=2230877 RepID=A0ABZ2SNF7_9ENTE|nr:hypothetical protein [Enterococcus sp. DIV2402]MBO0463913.1 hypothetical protein [Enterococcus sp. DIV2402]